MNNHTIDYPDLVAEIPCGILVIDRNYRIVFANEYVGKLTGFSPADLSGNAIGKIGLGNDDATSPTAMWNSREWADHAALSTKTFLISSDHREIPVLLRGKCFSGRDAVLYYALCLFEPTAIDETPADNEPPATARDHFHGLIGKAPQMQDLYRLIEMASETGVNVVIQGASGTGKELVASAIHYSSPRHAEPFIRVNCAALAETLLESELFGHVKGAFTGAYKDRMGTFQAAHKGTILLDEIGEISPMMQVKLLRVLQERVVVRVGDHREQPVDVRIIASTNKDLRKLVKKGTFREDLFYRLNVFPMHLPPLNRRKADIPLLCTHFLKKYRTDTGKPITTISPDAMRLLMEYCWPGNVRELENTIAHAFVLCRTEEIQLFDLPYELREKIIRDGICSDALAAAEPAVIPVPQYRHRAGNRRLLSKEELTALIAQHNGNKSATARALGISTVALWKKLKKFEVKTE
jgi:two-component system response regulator HydG